MQIGQMRRSAATGLGAAVVVGKISINSIAQAAEQGCRADGISTNAVEGGSFDPEAIALMQTVLDVAWASLLPTRRICTSRTIVAKRALELAARGERDRVRLCAFALGGIEWLDRFRRVRTTNSKMAEVVT
jgi:predicted RNA-binding Zn ribbon-like protein